MRFAQRSLKETLTDAAAAIFARADALNAVEPPKPELAPPPEHAPSSRKTLDALAASLKPGAYKALIADIRAAKEQELLPREKGAYKSTRRPAADPLTSEVTALLAPILARSAEKAICWSII